MKFFAFTLLQFNIFPFCEDICSAGYIVSDDGEYILTIQQNSKLTVR